jgi:hypothetical protein
MQHHFTMIKFFPLALALLLFLSMVETSFGQSQKEVKSFLVCGDSKLLLVDYAGSSSGEPAIIWTWDGQKASDLPESFRSRKFNTMDDCKPVNSGKQVLVSSSSGAIALLDAKDQKVLFYAAVPNAHSIELLPGNLIAAAASTHAQGNKIMLFDVTQPEKAISEDSLYSAHGTVWHEETQRLYTLGYDVLRIYQIADGQLVRDQEWKIPGESGHDLSMAADGKSFFVTEHTGTWRFDLESKEFTKIPDFPDAENIKSVGENKSGQFIYTVPEESWWTFHVSFHKPSHQVAFPDIKVYKARWFE